MQKQSARIKCKNNLFKSASDMMRLVKTTTYAQNNNIQSYFQIRQNEITHWLFLNDSSAGSSAYVEEGW